MAERERDHRSTPHRAHSIWDLGCGLLIWFARQQAALGVGRWRALVIDGCCARFFWICVKVPAVVVVGQGGEGGGGLERRLRWRWDHLIVQSPPWASLAPWEENDPASYRARSTRDRTRPLSRSSLRLRETKKKKKREGDRKVHVFLLCFFPTKPKLPKLFMKLRFFSLRAPPFSPPLPRFPHAHTHAELHQTTPNYTRKQGDLRLREA